MATTFKKTTKEKNYIDVTNDWLNNATPNSHEIKIDDYFTDDNGIKHPIKGKEMIDLQTTDSDEYKVACLIKSILGGDIHLVPRVIDISNSGPGIHTPDYRINGKKWNLKTPGVDGFFENSFERFVKRKYAKMQAKKYIINYKNFPNKRDEEILKVVEDTLNNPSRQWIENVILIHDNKIIKIFEKK